VIQPGNVDVLLAPFGRDHRSGYSVALIAIAPWMPTRIVIAGTSRRDSRVLNLVFSGSDEPFSGPLLHYGVWDNFSPQKKQYSEKHTSIHEYEYKNFARKRLRVLSGGRFSPGESGLVENSQLALVT
jgi:hypothetical protein